MEICKSMFTKLETLIGLFILCNPLYASKEYLESGINNANLYIPISKRIGNLKYHSGGEIKLDGTGSKQTYGSESNNKQALCHQNLRSGVIIKATESIKAGAEYIKSIKDVSSNEVCTQFCCQSTTCDVAVYQDKDDRFCYLFNCAGKCIFKEHAGYYVSDIMRRKLEQTEEELHSLNNDLQELDSSTVQEKVNKDQTSDKQDLGNNDNDSKYHLKTVVDDVAKAASLPPTEPFIAPHSVGLKGYCTQSMQCEDPNAACIDHNCYCKNGYYIKDGLCRKVCPALSFECFELGTLSRGPECISRKNVCDSYMHCADGSDEFNCDSIVASPQISDLNRLSSGGTNTRQGQGQSEALLKSAAQTSLKNSKPSQQLSQDSTRQDLQKNFESKDDSSQKDRELQAGQISLQVLDFLNQAV